MSKWHWQAGLALMAAMAVGCADKENKGVPRHEQQLLSAEDRQFEQAADPPLMANTHFAAGQLAESQGNLAGAIEQYTRALQVDARHEPSLFRLAIAQSRLGRHAQAIQCWKRYIELTNHAAAGYSNLGYAYEIAGQRAEAEAAYRKGIEIDPTSQPCRVNYGLMLARTGKLNEAVEQLSAVLTPAQVHYNLGSVYESLGDRTNARLHYRRSIELDPSFHAAQSRLAAIE